MGNGEFSVFFDESRRAAMLHGLFASYYARVPEEQVIFDTNRSWTGSIPLLAELFPSARVICCVREVGWILDSIERIRARNPLQVPKMFTPEAAATIYTRAASLMDSSSGLIGSAWSTLREAWFSDQAHRLIVIPYESLARQPEPTLRRLYEELGYDPFEHDLQHVRYEEPEYDTQIGLPGLHSVRSVVGFEERAPAVPPDLFAKYANTNFWAQAELNPRRVAVL